MMYGFDIYCGNGNIDSELQGPQKCSAIVEKLSKHLHSQSWHNLCFDDWSTTLELSHYLISKKLSCWNGLRKPAPWLFHVN